MLSPQELERHRFDAFELIIDAVRPIQAVYALGCHGTPFDDIESARRQGLPSLAMLPMLFTTSLQEEITGINPVRSVVSPRSLLASQSYRLPNGPVLIGETLTGHTSVGSVSDRESNGRRTRRVTLVTEYRRHDGELCLVTTTESLDLDPTSAP